MHVCYFTHYTHTLTHLDGEEERERESERVSESMIYGAFILVFFSISFYRIPAHTLCCVLSMHLDEMICSMHRHTMCGERASKWIFHTSFSAVGSGSDSGSGFALSE